MSQSLPQLLREKRGDTSKAEAARQLEVSRMTYRMWEDGVWSPRVSNYGKLADWLGLPRDQVLNMLARSAAS